MELDPVCKMKVDPQSAKFALTFKGKSYYFCCERCKKKFETNPEEYLKKLK